MTKLILRWHKKRLIFVVGIIVFALASAGVAAEETGSPQDMPADSTIAVTDLPVEHEEHTSDVLQELVQLLDQESELATKSKMNIDFVPGIMSVMHGKDLMARGVQNVYEALGLIPGVELSRTNDGQPQILVRGIGKTFFSSKIKMLLNNTAFNATLGAATSLLILPIEQVERIEVIRGPGSAIYGEYASVGVINVITRKDRNVLFTRAEDIGKNTLGGLFSYSSPENEFSANLSASVVRADGGDVEAGYDILFGTPLEQYSNAPGKVNNAERHGSVILDVHYKGYSFALQRVQQGSGDYFGLANALPDDEQRIAKYITMQSVELSREWEFGADWKSKSSIGILQFDLDSNPHQLFPTGFLPPPPPPPPVQPPFVYPEGVLGAPNYRDNKIYLNTDFIYTGMEKHEFLFGAEFSRVKPDEIYVIRNYDPATLQPESTPPVLQRHEGDENWLEEGHDRQVIGIYAQDQLQVGQKLKLTLGMRFDYYDDVGSDVTPRFAGVYSLADNQTLKFQYARSFRPPTFLELYTQNNLIVSGNEDLKSERIDTLEAGYAYNNGSSIFRSSFFYFIAKDLITVDSVSRQYKNQGEITSTGFELELQHQMSRNVKLDAAVTKFFTDNDQTKANVAGVAELLSNFAILLQPWPDYAFGVQFKAVGDRPREPGDSRLDLDGYTVIDVTANMFNLGLRNLNLRTGIKNIFDNDIVYPAPMASLPSGAVVPGYINDYPQTGREIFLQLDYQFD